MTVDLAISPDAARWRPEPPARPARPRPPRRHPEAWPLLHPPAEQWTHQGIDCAIALGFAAWNGYVRLPKRHPWRWRAYDEMPVQVHGGLTYGPERAMRLPEYGIDRTARPASAVGGWVGFDTVHAWDYWPLEELPELDPVAARTRATLNDLTADMRYGHRVDWSRARLRAEVEHLAEQVAAVPLERPVERAHRRRLTSSLRTLERRRARRARRRPVNA